MPANTESKRILVVDDDQTILDLLGVILRSGGYAVETATNGVTALEMVRQGPFDLIITNMVMGGMTGVELAQAVRRTHPHQKLLLVTGSPPADVSLWFDAVLLKPFLADELRRVVWRLLPPGS
jgi:CheY-like chemotaxis protein